MARNQDDHVKNISFLMDRNGTWSLSPAYDVTYAFNPENFWLKQHQMSVNGKLDHIKRQDLREAGLVMNIDKEKSEKIMDRVSRAVSDWLTYAEKCLVPEEKAMIVKSNQLPEL